MFTEEPVYRVSGRDTLGILSVNFNKGDNFCVFLFAFLHNKSLLKRVKWIYSKRKEFAPSGSKFFSFREDPYSEGSQNNFERFVSLENVSIPLRCWEHR